MAARRRQWDCVFSKQRPSSRKTSIGHDSDCVSAGDRKCGSDVLFVGFLDSLRAETESKKRRRAAAANAIASSGITCQPEEIVSAVPLEKVVSEVPPKEVLSVVPPKKEVVLVCRKMCVVYAQATAVGRNAADAGDAVSTAVRLRPTAAVVNNCASDNGNSHSNCDNSMTTFRRVRSADDDIGDRSLIEYVYGGDRARTTAGLHAFDSIKCENCQRISGKYVVDVVRKKPVPCSGRRPRWITAEEQFRCPF